MVYRILHRVFAAGGLFLLLVQPGRAADCAWIVEGIGKPEPAVPSSNPELCREGFLLSYNPATKVADWVMGRIIPERLAGPARREDAAFKPDPSLPINGQAALADYKGSGFDRGHLAPAGDMAWDAAAMAESFYLSNVAPQVGVGFNRGVWAALEGEIREAAAAGELSVVTGPVFFDFEPRLGSSRVVVPDAFYKALYDPATGETKAWLIPNRALPGETPAAFAIALERLEALTGLDFFPEGDCEKSR